MAHPASSSAGGLRIVAGAGLLVLSGLLIVRAAGVWPGDEIVWPALVALTGALLIWRQPAPIELGRWRGWAAHRRRAERPPPQGPAVLRRLPRPELSRSGLGIALVLAAGLAFLWAKDAARPAGEALLAALVVLLATALIFAPSWRRLARTLAAERAARIRTQERAELSAQLHDSMLQTLALIQRSSDQPQRVQVLARQQERRLRSWLAGEAPEEAGERLAAALQAAAGEIEAQTGGTVEVVAVGDCPLGERARAVLAASREAMLNAAKFGGPGAVAVYAELSPARLRVFVRDRGPGFEPEAVPADRRGVRESIVGRMERAGGRAVLRSGPEGGTEVEISLELEGSR